MLLILAQFEEERDFPYKNVQFMQSLLSELPLKTQSYSYSQPSQLSNILGGGGIADVIAALLGGSTRKKEEKEEEEITDPNVGRYTT